MLVLGRGKGEAVIVDGECKIVVIEVRGKVVRLGFIAPGTTTIVREEVINKEEK